MDIIATKIVITDWRPAQRFWNIFQLFDPADISPLPVRTALSAARYEESYREVRDAPAVDWQQVGEKLKIAAALGLSRLRHLPAADPESDHILAEQLREIFATPPAEFVALVNWPLLEHSVTEFGAYEGDAAQTRALLFCNYIAAAGQVWLERLRADFEELTSREDTTSPLYPFPRESMF